MPTVRTLNENDDIFVGVTLPLQPGTTGHFKQSKTISEQAFSNLKNLILTSKGERVGQPNFGCDVHRIVFEPIIESTADSIEFAVRDSVETWLPYITLHNVFVSVGDQDDNRILLNIEYSINSEDPDSLQNISFNFNVGI